MNNKCLPSKKTKIVCTIGPASESFDVLFDMINKGMNVARINFAHGTLEGHRRVIATIREAAVEAKKRVAIMGDLPGPKMRIGQLANDVVVLQRGQTFILQTDDILGDQERVSMSFSGLPKVVKPGDKIFVNDGYIQLSVERVVDSEVLCTVLVGGELRSYKGVNFPGIDLGISAFTERDHEFLKFASEVELDAISQSFVEGPHDIEAVQKAALALDYHPFIIAKIERARAVDNLDAILDVTDGIMVARGDLGVEIPIEEVAIVQKKIIRKSNLAGKPVITATHMLESMVEHVRPTRAEATDVANAILDGTDCLMLSGETAMGEFPVESVDVMSCIARVAEPYSCKRDVANILDEKKSSGEISTDDLISLSIFMSVEALSPVIVVTPTMSGATSRRVSRFRLPVWIIGVSPYEQTCQNLQFTYGVYPVYEKVRPATWESYAHDWLADHGMVEHLAVLTQGSSYRNAGSTNHIEIIDLSNPSVERAVW